MRNFEKTTRSSARVASFADMYEGKKGDKRNKPKRDRASKRAAWEI